MYNVQNMNIQFYLLNIIALFEFKLFILFKILFVRKLYLIHFALTLNMPNLLNGIIHLQTLKQSSSFDKSKQ